MTQKLMILEFIEPELTIPEIYLKKEKKNFKGNSKVFFAK
jgi:hypothetical protein